MKIIFNLIRKFFRIYWTSYILVHIFLFATSYFISSLILTNANPEVISENHIVLLNGMGVMTSFFILVIDKLNLARLKTMYTKIEKVPLVKREITQGVRMLNFIFSITFSMFILLGTQYIMLLFGEKSMFFLSALMLYVFIGFIVVLGVWHGLEILDDVKTD
ncbi:MAG: hypothetical protein FD179_999 [Erysipelotrichaceae bacterium]|nr:MAG: hypothetical protein FD179_999 [Erysipelotrichaceae bacterium]